MEVTSSGSDVDPFEVARDRADLEPIPADRRRSVARQRHDADSCALELDRDRTHVVIHLLRRLVWPCQCLSIRVRQYGTF